MAALWRAFIQLFNSDNHQPEYKVTPSSSDQAHDLGHASKCVWELDKEA